MDKVQELVKLLSVGKENAVTSADLSISLGIPITGTTTVLRNLVRAAIVNGTPIGSGYHGYFIIGTAKDLLEVTHSLTNRAQEILGRVRDIRQGFVKIRRRRINESKVA